MPWLDVCSDEKNMIIFSRVRGLVVLQFCFITRIIPILGDKKVSSGSISVIWSVLDAKSFYKDCWSCQWNRSPKWDTRICTMLSVQKPDLSVQKYCFGSCPPLNCLEYQHYLQWYILLLAEKLIPIFSCYSYSSHRKMLVINKEKLSFQASILYS